ncbi:PDR/VanB family oxidoreductase [Shewanella sp. UCD-KL21]|uniref:PDR/VanB family oxidoreductase n=1 Tax=Shewanella sp. UCD-KL21 TaxID=1917164 RepID=UPI000970612E|nr:PDR/VanB family oxidoreductase [Shewanella sp. UCD-KL21]
MFDVVIKNKNQETTNITSFELAAVNGTSLPTFTTGSHIDVHIADNIVRQYSLINHPQSAEFYKIAVLKDANSTGGSIAMHQDVNVGDVIKISAPRNLFPLNLESEKVVLFAGGIGITPIMSMAIELDSLGKDFELHYHTRSKSNTAFYQQLVNSSFASNVYFYFEDQPELDTNKVNDALANFSATRHLYTCGPGGYMDYIFSSAKAHGWDENNLHKEVFKAAAVDTSADQAFKLILTRSNLEIEVAADQTPLEAIEDAGIFIEVSCEMGVCGTCLTKVTDGIPDHRDEFLTATEKAKNDQFTPCCSRARTSTLSVDL